MSKPKKPSKPQVDTHWIYYDTLFRHGSLGTVYRMFWDLVLCQPDTEWTTRSFLDDCRMVLDDSPCPERIGALLEHAWMCGLIHSPQPDGTHFLARTWTKQKI